MVTNKSRVYLNFYFQQFTAGDRVFVIVPKNERTATYVSRIPGEVIDVRGCCLKFYEIATEYGILAAQYRVGDLQEHHGTL